MPGQLDPSCADYTTDVPLFESRDDAVRHGIRDVLAPFVEASKVIERVVGVREENGPLGRLLTSQ